MTPDEPESTPSRATPKYVPTLTEAVEALTAHTAPAALGPDPGLPAAQAPTPSAAQAVPALDERLSQAVLAALGPQLDHVLSDAVARVVHEQLFGLSARVRVEVLDTVRQQVQQYLLRYPAAAQNGDQGLP